MNTIETDHLATVTGGQNNNSATMPGAEGSDWRKACSERAYMSGMSAGSNNNWPSTTQEFEQRANSACDAGIADMRSSLTGSR